MQEVVGNDERRTLHDHESASRGEKWRFAGFSTEIELAHQLWGERPSGAFHSLIGVGTFHLARTLGRGGKRPPDLRFEANALDHSLTKGRLRTSRSGLLAPPTCSSPC